MTAAGIWVFVLVLASKSTKTIGCTFDCQYVDHVNYSWSEALLAPVAGATIPGLAAPASFCTSDGFPPVEIALVPFGSTTPFFSVVLAVQLGSRGITGIAPGGLVCWGGAAAILNNSAAFQRDIDDLNLSDVMGLNLSYNLLTMAPMEALRSALFVHMEYNNVSVLPAAAFENIDSMVINFTEQSYDHNRCELLAGLLRARLVLLVANNSLSELPDALFATTTESTQIYMNMQHNNLQVLQSEIFFRGSGITRYADGSIVLDLEFNRVSVLDNNTIDTFAGSHLTLRLSNNKMTKIGPYALNGGLATLNIFVDNNHLSALPVELFASLESRTTVFLSVANNKITDLPAGIFSSNCHGCSITVDLAHNAITQLGSTELLSRIDATTSVFLDLNYNGLVALASTIIADSNVFIASSVGNPLNLSGCLASESDDDDSDFVAGT